MLLTTVEVKREVILSFGFCCPRESVSRISGRVELCDEMDGDDALRNSGPTLLVFGVGFVGVEPIISHLPGAGRGGIMGIRVLCEMPNDQLADFGLIVKNSRTLGFAFRRLVAECKAFRTGGVVLTSVKLRSSSGLGVRFPCFPNEVRVRKQFGASSL